MPALARGRFNQRAYRQEPRRLMLHRGPARRWSRYRLVAGNDSIGQGRGDSGPVRASARQLPIITGNCTRQLRHRSACVRAIVCRLYVCSRIHGLDGAGCPGRRCRAAGPCPGMAGIRAARATPMRPAGKIAPPPRRHPSRARLQPRWHDRTLPDQECSGLPRQ